MSHTLIDTASSTLDTVSHSLKDAASSTLGTVSQFVDDARGRLDHVPVLHHATPWWRSKTAIAVGVFALLASGWMMRRRRADRRADAHAASLENSRGATARAADAAAARVDLESVGANVKASNELGAKVKGEGEIAPRKAS